MRMIHPPALTLLDTFNKAFLKRYGCHNLLPPGFILTSLWYPSGFGVLRLTKAPAVVCEASFYSNPEEERRLRKKSYNRREAYGYFLGIVRYVAAGFPQGILQAPAPESTTEHKTPKIEISISDGIHTRGAWIIKRQQVFSDSIRVKLDGVVVQHRYLQDSDLIEVTPTEPLTNGVHWVETSLINYYGNAACLQRSGLRLRHPQHNYK